MRPLVKALIGGLFILAIGTIAYIVFWQVLLRSPNIVGLVTQQPSGPANIAISERADIIVMRYGILPMYWTRFEPPYLGGYHTGFFAFLIVITLISMQFYLSRAKRIKLKKKEEGSIYRYAPYPY